MRTLLLGGMLIFATAFSATPAFASSGIVSPQAANVPITTSISQNWAGYASDSVSNYTSVTGTWTVPSVTASTSVAADATWVGIGGLSDTSLIQAGTQAIVQNGSTTYEAWYETLPDASNVVSLSVRPGDSITTTLTETSSNTWLIQIVDNTTGQQYSTTVNYTSTLSSAEWIQEMPSVQTGEYIPLDNFGTISFTNASAVVNGARENLTESNARALTIVSGGLGSSVLAYPSALGSDGASFTVTRSDTDSTIIPHLESIGGRHGFTRGPGGIRGFMPSDPQRFSDASSSQLQSQIQQMQSLIGDEDPEISQLLQSIPLSSGTQIHTYTSGPLTIQVTTYSN